MTSTSVRTRRDHLVCSAASRYSPAVLKSQVNNLLPSTSHQFRRASSLLLPLFLSHHLRLPLHPLDLLIPHRPRASSHCFSCALFCARNDLTFACGDLFLTHLVRELPALRPSTTTRFICIRLFSFVLLLRYNILDWA